GARRGRPQSRARPAHHGCCGVSSGTLLERCPAWRLETNDCNVIATTYYSYRAVSVPRRSARMFRSASEGVGVMSRLPTKSGAFLSALACSPMLLVSLRAQQPAAPAQPPADQPAGRGGQRGERGGQPAGQPGAQPAAPPAKPLIPVATNTVNANPDAYYGQGVTITAAVDQVLSKSAFAVDQRRVAGAPAPSKPTDV